jgi:hypothetical protein
MVGNKSRFTIHRWSSPHVSQNAIRGAMALGQLKPESVMTNMLEYWNKWLTTIILDFVHHPGLLKPLRFWNWLWFYFHANGTWKGTYSVGSVGRATLKPLRGPTEYASLASSSPICDQNYSTENETEHKSASEAQVLRLNTRRQADTVTVTLSKLALCSPRLIMFVIKLRGRDGLVL